MISISLRVTTKSAGIGILLVLFSLIFSFFQIHNGCTVTWYQFFVRLLKASSMPGETPPRVYTWDP